MKQDRRKFLSHVATVGLLPLVPASFKSENQEKTDPFFNTYKGRNKIGFNLLLWTASVSDKMNPVASRLKEIGYDGIEVAMGELKTQPYVDYGKYLKSIDLEVSAVLAVGKDEDPINESKAVRDKAVEKLKWAVDRANDLGAKVICGPFHSAFANFRKRPPSDDEYKWSAEVLHQAGEYAAKSNIIFAVEALNRFECYLCNTMEQLNKLVKLADHPNIQPMFDTHHANIEEKDFVKAINTLKSSLVHVHISENDRGTPGDGHIRWDKVFSGLSSINYKGWLTIEAFSRSDIDFANSIHVWREFSKPWDVVVNGISFIKMMQAKYHL